MHDITFIEVKTKGMTLSPEQEEWKEALEQAGCKYRIERPETLGKPIH